MKTSFYGFVKLALHSPLTTTIVYTASLNFLKYIKQVKRKHCGYLLEIEFLVALTQYYNSDNRLNN